MNDWPDDPEPADLATIRATLGTREQAESKLSTLTNPERMALLAALYDGVAVDASILGRAAKKAAKRIRIGQIRA